MSLLEVSQQTDVTKMPDGHFCEVEIFAGHEMGTVWARNGHRPYSLT